MNIEKEEVAIKTSKENEGKLSSESLNGPPHTERKSIAFYGAAIASASSVMVAQNDGARQLGRIRKAISALAAIIIYSVVYRNTLKTLSQVMPV